MSKRGYYLGGHGLTFGSASKWEDEEYWSEAKAKADAVRQRELAAEPSIRVKLDAAESSRVAIRASLLDGTLSLKEGEPALVGLLAKIEDLRTEAQAAGVKFAPADGIGRTLIQTREMLAMVEMLSTWDDGDDLEVIRLYLD